MCSVLCSGLKFLMMLLCMSVSVFDEKIGCVLCVMGVLCVV